MTPDRLPAEVEAWIRGRRRARARDWWRLTLIATAGVLAMAGIAYAVL